MGIPVPTLSSAGYVSSPNEKADVLMAHFYETMASDTFLYTRLSVQSLQSLIANNSPNMSKLTSALDTYLRQYLGDYYDTVDLEVTSDEYVVRDGKVTITIRCNVTEDGVTRSMAYMLTTLDGHFATINRINNEGALE